jgi:hypothetical protein
MLKLSQAGDKIWVSKIIKNKTILY